MDVLKNAEMIFLNRELCAMRFRAIQDDSVSHLALNEVMWMIKMMDSGMVGR